MSRVGKYPVPVPAGVTVTVNETEVVAKGKLGELRFALSPALVDTVLENGHVVVTPKSKTKLARMMWGTTRARINNLIKGVSEGFQKKLEIVGVGYRAAVQGSTLQLNLGFSHDVNLTVPTGLTVKVPTPTTVEIAGSDKQAVGQFAAVIRAYRPPEPYKGKGIKYAGEAILRKEGKKK